MTDFAFNPPVYYHGTHERNLDSIRKEGLRSGTHFTKRSDQAAHIAIAKHGESARVVKFIASPEHQLTNQRGDPYAGNSLGIVGSQVSPNNIKKIYNPRFRNV